MNILVFIKQVADTEARILIQGDGKTLEIENKYNVNFFDEFAIEEAIKVRDKMKGSQITACTLGTKKGIEALRTAIAMGADRAFLIDNTGVATDDSLIIAKILAGFARQGSYDLILCGRQAIDDENGSVGIMVAELLGIPHGNAILKLEVVDEGKVRVESEIEGGKETLEITLPALLTTQKGLNTPRVPLIAGVMKAMKASIATLDPVSLGLAGDEINAGAAGTALLSYESKQERPPVKMIGGETPEEKAGNLIAALKEEAKVI